MQVVRHVLELTEPILGEPKQRLFLKWSRNEKHIFAFLEEIKDIFSNEFSRTDRRPPIQNWFAKLYPFKGDNTKQLMVGTALMRLARQVTLLIEDAVSFNVLDWRTYQNLKWIFLMAKGVNKPAILRASVSEVTLPTM